MSTKRAASSPPSAQQHFPKRNRADSNGSSPVSDPKSPSHRGRDPVKEQGLEARPSRLRSLEPPEDPSASAAGAYTCEKADDQASIKLLDRIQGAINYTRTRLMHDAPVMQTTRFEIPLRTATHTSSKTHATALALLKASPAVVILSSPSSIIYELGVPAPEVVVPGVGATPLHSPQWWVGKTAAEVRAGPWADEVDLQRAASKVKEMETKKRKNAGRKTVRQQDIDWKLEEGLRRQEAGIEMFQNGDDDTEDTDGHAEDKHAVADEVDDQGTGDEYVEGELDEE